MTTEKDTTSNRFELAFFIEQVSSVLGPTDKGVVTEASMDFMELHPDGQFSVDLYAYYIGMVLLERGLNNGAAECFQRAFTTTNPFSEQCPVYAQCFVESVVRYAVTEDLSPQGLEWCQSKKPILQAAMVCIEHYRLFEIFREGYTQAKGEKEDISFPPEVYEKVKLMAAAQDQINYLLTL